MAGILNDVSTGKSDTTPSALERAIAATTDALLARQQSDGHWVFELEADATIPAEYVLLRHYLGEPVDAALEAKIAVYLRRIQGAHGGWPLFRDGDLDVSATVKAYFALKMIGDDPQAAHMIRAREALHARGGAERANVFTRIIVRIYSVARRADDAGRDHAAAEMVSDPSRQDVVLEPHRHRAAVGADGEAAGCA
jgi:squalene-hopene/tetraprenyl-beta-curcumene cyclase